MTRFTKANNHRIRRLLKLAFPLLDQFEKVEERTLFYLNTQVYFSLYSSLNLFWQPYNSNNWTGIPQRSIKRHLAMLWSRKKRRKVSPMWLSHVLNISSTQGQQWFWKCGRSLATYWRWQHRGTLEDVCYFSSQELQISIMFGII